MLGVLWCAAEVCVFAGSLLSVMVVCEKETM